MGRCQMSHWFRITITYIQRWMKCLIFILDNSVLSVIFIISFNWVDLMLSLINSFVSRVCDWTLSNHLDLSLFYLWIYAGSCLDEENFIQFSLAYFYYMLQIYSDFSLTLFPHLRFWLLTQPLIGCFAMLCWASRQVSAFWKVAIGV